MSGSISFKSEYGVGTKFTFEIKDQPHPENEKPNVLLRYSSADFEDSKVDNSNIAILFPKSDYNNCRQYHSPSSPTRLKQKILVVDDEAICGNVVVNFSKALKITADYVLLFL